MARYCPALLSILLFNCHAVLRQIHRDDDDDDDDVCSLAEFKFTR